MYSSNILFLSKIFISKIQSADELAESYFNRENVVNSFVEVEEYEKIPETYSSLNEWNVKNIMCFNTNIILKGPHKHPFIPISIKKCNTVLFDDLNKIDIKKLTVSKKKTTPVLSAPKENISIEENKGTEYVEMKTFGIFYDFNVAYNFILNSNWSDNIKWERTNLLDYLHRLWYKRPMTCLGVIPDKFMLKQFGGNLPNIEYIEELDKCAEG